MVLSRQTYVDQDLLAARTESALGRALYDLERKYTESGPYLHDALPLEYTVTLATTLVREGKAAEAEPLLRDSLIQAKANRLIGTAPPENIEGTLAECLRAQGR